MAKINCVDNFGNLHQFEESEYIPRESVHGILIKDNSILLVEDRHSLFWDFPGGKVEKDEDLQTALNREFIEETGIKNLTIYKEVESFVDYFFNVHSQEPWKSLRHFFLITAETNQLNQQTGIEDINQAKFIKISELANYKVKNKALDIISKL